MLWKKKKGNNKSQYFREKRRRGGFISKRSTVWLVFGWVSEGVDEREREGAYFIYSFASDVILSFLFYFTLGGSCKGIVLPSLDSLHKYMATANSSLSSTPSLKKKTIIENNYSNKRKKKKVQRQVSRVHSISKVKLRSYWVYNILFSWLTLSMSLNSHMVLKTSLANPVGNNASRTFSQMVLYGIVHVW
jgi:hypothetical protein